MSERIEREQEKTNPPEFSREREAVDAHRRGFTRLGATSTPILMTLASRPVFGANCLSNALSGNLSDPDRGNCSLGLSVATIAQLHKWGPVDPDAEYVDSSRIGSSIRGGIDPSRPETLRAAITNSDYPDRQIIIAAWANTMVTTGYIIREDQLFDMLEGTLPVPGDLDLVDYLASTMKF